MHKKKKFILSIALIVVLTGQFLLPMQGQAQELSSVASGEEVGSFSETILPESSSATASGSESTASSSALSSGGIASASASSSTALGSSVASASEPDSSSSAPASASAPDSSSAPGSSSSSSSQPVRNAEETIHVPDGQTLVLGESGVFIFRIDAGEHEEIGAEEWETPAGYYDVETGLVLDGTSANLRSVVHAQISSISGPACALKIVGGSDITVLASSDIAVDIGGMRISEDVFELPTKIYIMGGQVGIQFRNEIHIGSKVEMQVTAEKNAIFLLKNPEEWSGNTIYVYQDANVNLQATGQEGIALSAESIHIFGASVTAKAPFGDGGILLEYQLMATMQNDVRAFVDASSAFGRAISCNNMDLSGTDLKGVTPGGEVGVHVDQYLSARNADGPNGASKIYGEAYSGYGVVANNISENAEYPSGSIYLTNSSLEGRVQEGMGVSTNTLSAHDEYGVNGEGRVVGTAQKGIGISVCMISANGTVHIEGLSFGASSNHYQVYNSIPHSAGISTLSSLNASGNVTIIGKAPKDIAGSYGIHSQLVHEGGHISGYFYINGQEDAPAKVLGVGETGIYSYSLNVNENSFLVAEGKLDGISTTMLYSQGYEEQRPSIKTTGEQGAGMNVMPSSIDNMSDVNIANSDIVATGGEYGFFARTNYFSSFQNTTLVAKATGSYAAAGMFVQALDKDDVGVMHVRLENSHIEASGTGYGLVFQDVQLFVSASNYILTQPAYIKGVGAESGIKLRYSDKYLDDYVSGLNKALHATDMLLPDGTQYTIWGISATVSPDKVGRKAAISVPSCEIEGDGILREEYLHLAQGRIRQTTPLAVYASGMNMENYTDFTWSAGDTALHVEPDSVTASGVGVFGAKIEIERVGGESENGAIVLTKGTHRISLLADINIATVHFYAEGGTPAKETLSVAMGTPIGAAPNVTKQGSEFVNWRYGEDDAPWNIETQPVETELLELYAVWNAIEYPLSFDANAGGADVQNMPTGASLIMGALLPKPAAVPTREGARFKRWSINAQGESAWDFDNDAMPAGEMTLYAIWEIEGYTITYDALGGTPATQSEITPFNTPIRREVSDPERDDFVFTGWYEDAENTLLWQPAGLMPARDFTVYAGWSHEYINITFTNGGVNAQNMPAPFKSVIGKEILFGEYQPGGKKAPVFENHVFLGWLNESGGFLPETQSAPTHDVTLVAQWEEIVIENPPENIVVYTGTKTKTEIESELDYSFTYLDLLHREHTLKAKLQWDDFVLASGGVAKIDLVFSQEGVRATVVKDAFEIYVLHHARISSQYSQTFAFGLEISFSGVEWEATCFAERPDFENKSITKTALPISFHLNGANVRVSGVYHPTFTVVYTDYFGEVKNLEYIVEAVVLPSNEGQVFDYWQTVAFQLQNTQSARQMLITPINYPFGGDPILFAPNVFNKRILARAGSYTLMPDNVLSTLKNAPNTQLQVDLDWIQWYFTTSDFNSEMEHFGVYPLDVVVGTNQKLLEDFAEEYTSMPLQFTMNKSWNGNPTIQIKVNKVLEQSEKQGNKLYMFWFNNGDQRLELIGDMKADGDGKFSVRMKSVNQHYIILDELPVDESGNPIFILSDKTNPLSEALLGKVNELNKGNPHAIIFDGPIIEQGKDEKTPMINMLFPSMLCVVIIIILLIIIVVLLVLYLRTRKKLKDSLKKGVRKRRKKKQSDENMDELANKNPELEQEENRVE